MFEKLNSSKKSSLVFQQIIEKIESGQFKKQTKLPNELELSRLLGVSRTVVREAMSALEIIDVIERRAGDGTYVKATLPRYEDVRFSNEPVVLNFLGKIDTHGGSYAAFEARFFLEPIIAGIVALRANEDDIETLREICSRFRLALQEKDCELFRQTDVAFHRFMAGACKNEFLKNFLLQMIGAEKYVLWRAELNWPSLGRMEKGVQEHLNIAEAVYRKDFDAACKATEAHFQFHWGEVARTVADDIAP